MNNQSIIIKHTELDVYDVIVGYDIKCPAVADALKILLTTGVTESKSYINDITDSIRALERALELYLDGQFQPVAIKNPTNETKPTDNIELYAKETENTKQPRDNRDAFKIPPD